MTFTSFGRPAVRHAIEHLAEADKLTVFVGAGVSAEAGLPRWGELVRRLLEEAARAGGFSSESQGLEWARKTLLTETPTGAAGIAETLLRKDLPKVLFHQLYRPLVSDGSDPRPSDFVPGPTSHAVAALRLACNEHHPKHGRMKILTMNYDDLLERAMKHAFNQKGQPELARQIVSMVWPRTTDPTGSDLTKVFHLHGLLTSPRPRGTLTLTDTSFYKVDRVTHPRDTFVTDRLNDSQCVFLGTSFTDPNLMRYVFASAEDRRGTTRRRRKDAPRHIALMTHQSNDPSEVLTVREEIVRERLRDSFVECVFLEHYADVSQFIYEVRNRIRASGGAPYDDRVRAWLRAIHEGVIFAEDLDRFIVAQDRFSRRLTEILRETVAQIDRLAKSRLQDEHLALAVWLLSTAGTHMTAWFTTDRSHRDPALLSPAEIDPDSHWLAVRALCQGKWVHTSDQLTDSRWSHIVDFPLLMDDGPLGRSCVGCLTLTTLTPPDQTALRKLGKHEETLTRQLNDKVAEMLALAVQA